MSFVCRLALLLLSAASAQAQSISIPWSGHGHDPQHTGISKVASQPFGQIRWSMPVDLNRVYSGTSLLVHYGAPLITRQNTVILAVKTGASDGFRMEARDPANGVLKYIHNTDYTQPPHNWVLPLGATLTPKNRLYLPGAGGTVYFRDNPDVADGATGQLAFYGLANYQGAPGTFNNNVKINTPITADRYGNIYFGFQVLGPTTPALQGGIARIDEDGTGSWISAATAANDGTMQKVVHACAPALSNDQKRLYFAVNSASSAGYLVMLDSRTLAPLARIRLKDVQNTSNDALLSDNGSASPTIGPDGDVYFGVLENPFLGHNLRGWLLHFDAALTQLKTPGSFGWDDTASIVPASLVPSYQGTSEYLLLTKYNSYAGYGSGDGRNMLAVLDPHATGPDPVDPVNGLPVMKEILKILSPTFDDQGPDFPDARREWCINMAAVDPFTKSAIVSCEDGKAYRWSFATNTLSEVMTLTDGIGEAYTPTVIGVDGTVYAIANGTLYVIGAAP